MMVDERIVQNNSNDFLTTLVKGALAGTIATLPMTTFMLLMIGAHLVWGTVLGLTVHLFGDD